MASRKEEKERRRQERLAQERAATEQARRRRTYGIFAGGVLVVATLAVVAIVVAVGGGSDGDGGSSGGPGEGGGLPEAVDPPPQRNRDLSQAAKAAGCKLSNPRIEGNMHVEGGVKYKTNPPTSGNHHPIQTPDGAYGKAPGITHLVHSLEHGRIEYQFNPSIPERRIAQLKGLFDEDPYHVIITPNPTKMSYQVAAVAWGHLAACKRITDETFDVLRAFKERYVDKGPEFVR